MKGIDFLQSFSPSFNKVVKGISIITVLRQAINSLDSGISDILIFYCQFLRFIDLFRNDDPAIKQFCFSAERQNKHKATWLVYFSFYFIYLFFVFICLRF